VELNSSHREIIRSDSGRHYSTSFREVLGEVPWYW
jgi:hypothetical protein